MCEFSVREDLCLPKEKYDSLDLAMNLVNSGEVHFSQCPVLSYGTINPCCVCVCVGVGVGGCVCVTVTVTVTVTVWGRVELEPLCLAM